MDIKLERVTLEKLESLRTIAIKTFIEAFSASNSEDNIQSYLQKSFAPAQLSYELTNENSEFYFAKADGETAGYLKLNTVEAQTDVFDKNGLEIERIYVLQRFYGKRVAQALFEKALTIAQQGEREFIWLGVWENNARAIRFYTKNGFVAFGEHTFMLGSDVQRDIMMKLELKAS